jgi:hypothetical protein
MTAVAGFSFSILAANSRSVLSSLRDQVRLDAATRFALGLMHPSYELEPLFYAARLATFGLIAVAVIDKNRPNISGKSNRG